MLSSRPAQLTTDTPYFPTKTPGRALSNRPENAHAGALSVNFKGKHANGVPRTPFQPASTREFLFMELNKENTNYSMMQNVRKGSKIKNLVLQLLQLVF